MKKQGRLFPSLRRAVADPWQAESHALLIETSPLLAGGNRGGETSAAAGEAKPCPFCGLWSQWTKLYPIYYTPVVKTAGFSWKEKALGEHSIEMEIEEN